MPFLDNLSNALLGQVGLTENAPTNLDHKGKAYGKLGDFASVIDKTAQRSYVETGTIRNIRPRSSEVLMQEPDVTVVVKKRLFSSLVENYSPDLMDEDELFFLRATKRLFYNKCRVIAAYERLTKFEKLAANGGQISDFAFPLIFNAVDAFTAFPATSNIINDETRSKLETIRKVKKFSDPSIFTTWNISDDLPYASANGLGTGTFDLTLVTNVSTKTSTVMGQGSASITIEDPYNLLVITDRDIEQAISDSVNIFRQNSFFTITENQLEQTIADLKDSLNAIRLNRGAARIIFRVEPDSILYKKVRAIIDEEGREIKFTFDAGSFGSELFSFDNSSVIVNPESLNGINGLQGSEIDLFKQILNNVYIMLSLKQTTRSEIKEYNEKTNNLRKKMMLHYHRKTLVQPMDIVNIFITSKTRTDSKITQGLDIDYITNSPLNKINQGIANIENSLDSLTASFSGGANSSFIEQEKNAIVGAEFPMWLYSLLRNDFTRQSAGTAAFVGVVQTAPRDYNASSGKHTITISINDNTSYLKQGTININPSVEVYNSSLYDPLTPFKTNFDEASGFSRGEIPTLLDANIRLLNSRSVKSKFGRFRDSAITLDSYQIRDVEHVASSKGPTSNLTPNQRLRLKLFDPDGFVYRWKEGIGSLVLYGEPHSTIGPQVGTFNSESSPNITKNPFAGQDVMNVVSLLITGKPYNFNTFVKGAISFGKLSGNDLNNESLSSSFFRSLVNDLTKQNATWGNFIPFKSLVINERAYEFLASGQFDLMLKNEELNKLLSERASKFDEIGSIALGIADTPQFYQTNILGGFEAKPDAANVSGITVLQSELTQLDKKIKTLTTDFHKEISQPANLKTSTGSLQVFGNDISYDSSLTTDSGTEAQKRRDRSDFRKRINQLTQRRLWKVKGNEDPNLFIVDDSYDKNYDIQAFEQTLTDRFQLFNSAYADPFEQVSIVSKFLGLEVFADSQGHIRAQAPQYNRMPSSVFAKILRDKAEKGIQIFPSYLEKLFFTSVKGLVEEIEIVEDQMRLRAAAIGKTTDAKITALFGSGFRFLTLRDTGNIRGDLRSLFYQDDPDLQENQGALKKFSGVLDGILDATINFSVVDRAKVILHDSDSFISKDELSVDASNVIKTISARLERKTGQKQPSSIIEILSNNRVTNERKQTDILKVVNDLSSYVSSRQRLIKSLGHSLKNLNDGLSVNAPGSRSAQSLLFPEINKTEEIPELLEHMIEDENIDDLGPGSGKRYVIQDKHIKSMKIAEEAPPYCMVQVDGRLETGIVSFASGLALDGAGGGGNAMGTAWAVDYDLWRMYGFKPATNQTVPFFNDPNTQCAPYAVYLLNLARKNIFRGNVTLAGNEFIQPGEVYYIESENMLFYSESVSHNLSFSNNGGSFTTSVTLTYGHNPGEYIPTPLDIIGKGLYANRNQASDVRHVRHGRADDDTHVATIVHDANNPVSVGIKAIESLVGGQFGEQNRKSLSNLLLVTEGLITPTKYGKVINVEIRTYFNSNSEINFSSSSDLNKIADSISAWLVNPRQFSLDGEELHAPADGELPTIPSDKIKITKVDLNPEILEEYRSPSSRAWNLSRDLLRNSNIPITKSITASEAVSAVEGGDLEETSQISNTLIDAERRVLMASMIDIWITFVDAEFVLEGNKNQDSSSQADQQEQGSI